MWPTRPSAIAGSLSSSARCWAVEHPAPPGMLVTRHFEPLHKLLSGNPPLIDLTLTKFSNVQQIMAQINSLGGPPPLELANKLSVALKDLQTHAKTLPAPWTK